jgi:hypothetical protein
MLADSNIYTSVEYLHKLSVEVTQQVHNTTIRSYSQRDTPEPGTPLVHTTRTTSTRRRAAKTTTWQIILLVDANKKTAVGGRDDDDDGATTTKTTFEMAGILTPRSFAELELRYSRIGISNAVAMVAARWRSSRR